MITVNRLSPEWLVLKRWANEEIEASRMRLEGPLQFEATQYERGKVAALRSLLDFVEPPLTPEVTDENYG